MKMKRFLLMAAMLCASGCGGGASSPTGPSVPPAAPTPAPNPSPSPAPTPTPAVMVLRSASIRGSNGHSAAGTAEIVQDGSSYRLEFRNDFRIDGGLNDVYLTGD